jgi:membrane fusion protein (multidrug efflux system)
MLSLLRQLVVLAVLVAGGVWIATERFGEADGSAARRGDRPPPVVAVAETREDEVERAVSAVGSGRALRSVELRVADDGRVTEVLFGPGERVRDGAALLRLDDEAERAALSEAEAELAEARAAFERAEALNDQGRITGSAFETAKAALLRAEARTELARVDLERRTLRAPFDGVLGFTEVEPGAMVSQADVIATLDDLAFLDADFSVPERFFGEVEPGDAVRAVTRAFPDETFEGEVVAIDRRVDEVSRSFRVRARFANPGFKLPAGLFLQVELVLDSRLATLAPEEALVMVGDGAHVFVVGEDDVVERRRVRVGVRFAGEAEILEGLAPGERVITRGVQKVREGQTVRVSEEGAGAGVAAAGGDPAPS